MKNQFIFDTNETIFKHGRNKKSFYKTIDTLPELYILLGQENLKNKLNALLTKPSLNGSQAFHP